MNVAVNSDFSVSAIGHCFFISSTQQWYFSAYLWMLLLSPVVIISILFIFIYPERGLSMLFYHNNPFTMVAAIATLYFFNSLSIQSRIINRIASCTPAVLLLSDMVFREQLYSFVHRIFIQNDLSVTFISYMAFLLIAVFATSFCIDTIRQILYNALFSKLTSHLDSKYPIPVK